MNLTFSEIPVLLLMLASMTLTGCDMSRAPGSIAEPVRRDLNPQQSLNTSANQQTVSVISGTELEALIRQSTRPVLVEFGVDVACPRCEQMRPQIVQLARQFEGKATVVRVDFNANRQSAMRYGATICPSYVIFDQSQVMQSRNFPTSADLLAVDLESVVEKEDAGH